MRVNKAPAAPRGKSGLLHDIGRARWGENYVTAMAAKLMLSRKTVRRMLDGVSPIPDAVWADLYHDLDNSILRQKKLRTQAFEHARLL